MTHCASLRKEFAACGDPEKARTLRRFFKTGPGEYAEGDIFLGIMVPQTRAFAAKYKDLPLKDAVTLLKSPIHEERFLALLILIARFRDSDDVGRKRIYDIYLAHTRYINNWDLVDVTAKHIVGAFLADKDRRPLRRLARSKLLWERRIAILSTFHFIEKGELDETLAVAGILLNDPEDLIHKAAGWMLREVGKRDRALEERFLKRRYKRMPRTMLRYAIERFPGRRRKAYLRGYI